MIRIETERLIIRTSQESVEKQLRYTKCVILILISQVTAR